VLSSQKVVVRRDKWQKGSRTTAELTARRGERGGCRKSTIIQESARTRFAVRTKEREMQDEIRRFSPSSWRRPNRISCDQRGVLIAFAEVLFVPPQQRKQKLPSFSLFSILGRIEQLIDAARERTILLD